MEKLLKKELNDQQYEAAIYTEWASLMLAWAWAGKTKTLTYKIAYMVHKWINPWNILAVTFTNKAANEMKERLQDIVENLDENINQNNEKQENNIENIEPDFDSLISWEFEENNFDEYLEDYDNNVSNINNDIIWYPIKFDWIWTFHSIFLKILKYDIEYINSILWTNYNKNFNIADEWDALSVLRKILKELNVKDVFTPKTIKWTISRLKNEWLTAKDFLYQANDDNDEIVWKIYQRYEKELRTQNTLDFDDLLLLPYLLFKSDKELLEKWKNRFKYILVDEAQDTNKIQFELIHMLSWPEGNITLIWDDFQSIYWWRWAVIDDFLNAKKYWPKLKIFKLEINYRSKKTIVEAWNLLISNNKAQYKKNIKAFNDKESKIKIIRFSSDEDEAIQVISLINKLHKKGKKWSDFAIIYRTNAQSEPFEKVLLSENIPYKVYGGFKFYERKEIKDILSYIKYIINPDDGISLSRIINVPWRKIWKTTIDTLSEQSTIQWVSLNSIIKNIDTTPLWNATKKNIQEFNNLINYIKEKVEKTEPAKSIETIVKAIKYENYLTKEFWETDSKERLANIWQLINTASNFKEKWIEWLRKFIDEISLFVDLEEKMEEQPDQVQLMTWHGSKWLEFDTVFLVGLEENVFPLSRARLNPKELEEERRLAYVWITRAKNNLFLTYSDSRKQFWQLKYNPVSRFIEEIPNHLTTSFNTSWSSENKSTFQIWDKVRHKLFWVWDVMEVFSDKIIVNFYWHGIRQIIWRMLEKIED